MAKNYFKRYVWLIDLISRHGYISKRDIDYAWQKSSLNDEREKSIPERTFHNHREAILDVFGIEISFARGQGITLLILTNWMAAKSTPGFWSQCH